MLNTSAAVDSSARRKHFLHIDASQQVLRTTIGRKGLSDGVRVEDAFLHLRQQNANAML